VQGVNKKRWSHPKHNQVGKEDTEDEFFENLAHHEIYSPTIDNHTLFWQSRPNMERRTWLVTFRQNCVKLAWAFINIMNVIHHHGILHNDLSKNNIMLHLPINKPNVMYIGVCNWGETRHLWKVTPSFYGFTKEQDATNTKTMHWRVAPKLFLFTTN
jgi:serine/threonine protein kinase